MSGLSLSLGLGLTSLRPSGGTPTPPTPNWILATGIWNDAALWMDDQPWKDA